MNYVPLKITGTIQVTLSHGWDLVGPLQFSSERLSQSDPTPLPSFEELADLAKKHPPPQEWFDEWLKDGPDDERPW
jgi:hypothetical protein